MLKQELGKLHNIEENGAKDSGHIGCNKAGTSMVLFFSENPRAN